MWYSPAHTKARRNWAIFFFCTSDRIKSQAGTYIVRCVLQTTILWKVYHCHLINKLTVYRCLAYKLFCFCALKVIPFVCIIPSPQMGTRLAATLVVRLAFIPVRVRVLFSINPCPLIRVTEPVAKPQICSPASLLVISRRHVVDNLVFYKGTHGNEKATFEPACVQRTRPCFWGPHKFIAWVRFGSKLPTMLFTRIHDPVFWGL